MKRYVFNNKGNVLIGIIIVLVVVGLISGGIYYYLSKQIPETPKITEKTPEEITNSTSTPSSTPTPSPNPSPSPNPTPTLTPTPTVQKCTDGTLYGQCSTNKPKYCESGNLIYKASLCGCPFGYKADNNKCVGEKLETGNNFTIIEDDGTLIFSGYTESDRGLISISKRVNEQEVIKKFFENHQDIYDFIVIITAFTPDGVGGHFGSAKLDVKGTSDTEYLNAITTANFLGFDGSQKFQGWALVPNIDNAENDLYFYLLHEISHRWLMHIGDIDSCGKAFGCTKETGFKINKDGGHYNEKVSTVTREGEKSYQDPNGGGSLELALTPGYCKDYGSGSEYRFIDFSLYLMGFIPTEKVKPLKWYETSGNWSDKGIPCVEKTMTVNDIINMVGVRQNAQRDFSVGFILLTQKNIPSNTSQITKMNSIINNFPLKWAEATGYNSTMQVKK